LKIYFNKNSIYKLFAPIFQNLPKPLFASLPLPQNSSDGKTKGNRRKGEEKPGPVHLIFLFRGYKLLPVFLSVQAQAQRAHPFPTSVSPPFSPTEDSWKLLPSAPCAAASALLQFLP
jgi:hypothetical protein